MPGEKEKERDEKNQDLEGLKEEEGGKIPIKTWVKIFGESFPDFWKASVHPASDQGDGVSGVGSIEVEDFEAGLAHVPSDGYILDQMATDGVVAFDFIVRVASKEKELAIGGTEATDVTPGPVRHVQKDEEMDEGDDQLFAPAEGFEIRPKG